MAIIKNTKKSLSDTFSDFLAILDNYYPWISEYFTDAPR